MPWKRNDKPGSEPTEDRTPVVPKPATEQERYCTTCNQWYKPSQSSQHEH